VERFECGRERATHRGSPKKQRQFYSGKKKCHTQKAQIVIDHASQSIVCVAVCAGKTHDFALYKATRLVLPASVELLGDTGYQGIARWHPNAQTPHKKSKKNPLTPEQKQQNRALSSRRIKVEHLLRYLKRFRILSATYRNRRKRFALRLNLLAAIANLHR